MSTSPNFAATPRFSGVNISTANTGRDGTGPMSLVFQAGNNGSRIDWIRTTQITTTTAGVVRYYVSGGNQLANLLQEQLVTAVTPSATTGALTYDFYPATALLIQSGYALTASTNNAEQFNVKAWGGDF